MSEKAKIKIIDSAINIISQKGYSAATTSEIAKTAGYSEATIFKYFQSKKGLFNALVHNFIEDVPESIGLHGIQSIIRNSKDLKFEEIVNLILEDRIQFIEKNYGFLKILIAEIQFHEDFRNTIIEQILKPITKDINALIKDQIEKGNVIEVDPFILFRTMFSGIFMSLLQRILTNKPLDIVVLRQEIEVVKNIFLNGVLKK